MVITGRFLNFMGLLQVPVLSPEIPPSKQLRLIRLNGLPKPLFLGRLRPDRLTSIQMVGHIKLCLEVQVAHLFLRPKWAGPIPVGT